MIETEIKPESSNNTNNTNNANTTDSSNRFNISPDTNYGSDILNMLMNSNNPNRGGSGSVGGSSGIPTGLPNQNLERSHIDLLTNTMVPNCNKLIIKIIIL